LSEKNKLSEELQRFIAAYPITNGSVTDISELTRRMTVYAQLAANGIPDEAATPTVRVRVAAAVNAKGEWHACGADGNSDEESAAIAKDMLDGYPLMNVSFIEARVPLPVPRAVTVQGEVKPNEVKS